MFESHKRISGQLYFGIVFLPFIFAWFTLQKGYSQTARVLSLSWMGLVLIILSGSFRENLDHEIVQSNEITSEAPVEVIQSQWQYSDLKDEMRKTKTDTALLSSDTIHELKFPYNGGSKLGIILYKRKNDIDVVVSLSKGAMLLTYNDSKIDVKFDDGEVISYVVSRPNSGVNNAGVVYNNKDFLKRLRKAQQVIIEVPIYEMGGLQFTFTNPGLKEGF